jgi:hypothetical protein
MSGYGAFSVTQVTAEPDDLPHLVSSATLPGKPARPGWTVGGAASGAVLMTGAVLATTGYAEVLSHVQAPHASPTTLLAVMVAAACSSVAGFAFSALCGAILFHALDAPVLAVEIMLVCSIAIQGVSVAALRNEIDWRSLVQFLAGGVAGLPVGLYGLLHLPKGVYGSVFGALLMAYGGIMAFRPPIRLRTDAAAWNIAAGAAGGITGGLAAFPGAFVTIWCGLKGWSKTRQRGVYQPFILVMQIMTVAAMATFTRMPGVPSSLDPGVIEHVPAALIGTCLGLWFFRRITDRHFAMAVNLLLIASGAALLL